MVAQARVIWDPGFTAYNFGPTHPMAPLRLDLTARLALDLGVITQTDIVSPPIADDDVLATVHDRGYIEKVKAASADPALADPAYGLGTDDDPAFAGMHEASARIVAGTVEMCRQVWTGESTHGVNFCGGMHHAMRDRAAGFCIYNDIAAGIRYLLDQGVERIAYVDVDVHHGDGVEALFVDDPRVLKRPAHDRIGIAAFLARDDERVGSPRAGDPYLEGHGPFTARQRIAQPRVGFAECLDIGGIDNRDDPSLAARAIGELRGAKATDGSHPDHEQRREKEKQESRGRDDGQEIAACDHEHVFQEGGHATTSSTASPSGIAAKLASTCRTIWTNASWSAGRAIDRPATPCPLAVMRPSSGSTSASSIAKCQASPFRSAPAGSNRATVSSVSRGV